MHGAGHRLDGGGVAQGDVVRQLVDHGGRSGELLGQTAVTGDADGAQVIAQLRTLGQAEFALAAVDVRVDGHAIADLDVGDIGTDRGDDAGILMAEHDRRNGGGGARTARVQVMVRAAHARVCGVDEHLVRQDLGGGKILDFEFLHTGKHQSLHDRSFHRRKRFRNMRIDGCSVRQFVLPDDLSIHSFILFCKSVFLKYLS